MTSPLKRPPPPLDRSALRRASDSAATSDLFGMSESSRTSSAADLFSSTDISFSPLPLHGLASTQTASGWGEAVKRRLLDVCPLAPSPSTTPRPLSPAASNVFTIVESASGSCSLPDTPLSSILSSYGPPTPSLFGPSSYEYREQKCPFRPPCGAGRSDDHHDDEAKTETGETLFEALTRTERTCRSFRSKEGLEFIRQRPSHEAAGDGRIGGGRGRPRPTAGVFSSSYLKRRASCGHSPSLLSPSRLSSTPPAPTSPHEPLTAAEFLETFRFPSEEQIAPAPIGLARPFPFFYAGLQPLDPESDRSPKRGKANLSDHDLPAIFRRADNDSSSFSSVSPILVPALAEDFSPWSETIPDASGNNKGGEEDLGDVDDTRILFGRLGKSAFVQSRTPDTIRPGSRGGCDIPPRTSLNASRDAQTPSAASTRRSSPSPANWSDAHPSTHPLPTHGHSPATLGLPLLQPTPEKVKAPFLVPGGGSETVATVDDQDAPGDPKHLSQCSAFTFGRDPGGGGEAWSVLRSDPDWAPSLSIEEEESARRSSFLAWPEEDDLDVGDLGIDSLPSLLALGGSSSSTFAIHLPSLPDAFALALDQHCQCVDSGPHHRDRSLTSISTASALSSSISSMAYPNLAILGRYCETSLFTNDDDSPRETSEINDDASTNDDSWLLEDVDSMEFDVTLFPIPPMHEVWAENFECEASIRSLAVAKTAIEYFPPDGQLDCIERCVSVPVSPIMPTQHPLVKTTTEDQLLRRSGSAPLPLLILKETTSNDDSPPLAT